jgi:protein phosphatase 1 regulatory subunit 11
MQRVRIYERTAADGSRTIVLHDSQPREIHPADPDQGESYEENEHPNDDSNPPRLVLNLQGGGSLRKKKKPGQRVVWKEDVVDNEGSGKKKSKSGYFAFTSSAFPATHMLVALRREQL